MNHKSATLVIQDLLKQTCKNGPLDIHSVKVRCFPCPHEPQFVTLKRTVHAKYCQREGRMSSSSSVPLSTFLLEIFSRSKLRRASADEETPQISTWTESRQEHECLSAGMTADCRGQPAGRGGERQTDVRSNQALPLNRPMTLDQLLNQFPTQWGHLEKSLITSISLGCCC